MSGNQCQEDKQQLMNGADGKKPLRLYLTRKGPSLGYHVCKFEIRNDSLNLWIKHTLTNDSAIEKNLRNFYLRILAI